MYVIRVDPNFVKVILFLACYIFWNFDFWERKFVPKKEAKAVDS